MVTITLFVVGLFLLIAGAEMLVRGATRLAVSLGVPPLLVGLTVVAYATGSPELAVSIQSARAGQSEIALGNVAGYAIARWQGIVLLSYYVAYTAFLVLEATGSVALPLYATAMAVFVLPLTAITLTVLALRELLGKRREERTRQRP